jgi:hypothetical protein
LPDRHAQRSSTIRKRRKVVAYRDIREFGHGSRLDVEVTRSYRSTMMILILAVMVGCTAQAAEL